MLIVILRIFEYACRAVEILILIRCILSWIPGLNNQFSEAVYRVTEPLLAPIRRLIMKVFNTRSIMIDFSPVVAFVLLGIIERIGYMILTRLFI